MTQPASMPEPPVMPEPHEVRSSDGVVLAAYDHTPDRPAVGRDLLVSHANGFCAAVFAPLVEAIGDRRCVSYDARAHGRSTRGDADMAWEGHRDDVLAVNETLGLDRPVGVGHSMGGAALLLAEQLRPGTFSALWLFEPIVFPVEFAEVAENSMEQAALRRRPDFPGREEAFANFAGKPPLSELCPRCLAAYVTYGFHPTGEQIGTTGVDTDGTREGESGPDGGATGGITLACRPEDEAAGYRMGARHHAWDHLAEIGCPVVVLRGRETDFSPASVAPRIAEIIPGGRLEAHDELGHFGPLADPAAMAESVLALLAAIEG